jgi:hypothetical protein|tara:strand:+ start:218 stop:466 length:249 start_codon:yes stop_codon:yes gene_type:complete
MNQYQDFKDKLRKGGLRIAIFWEGSGARSRIVFANIQSGKQNRGVNVIFQIYDGENGFSMFVEDQEMNIDNMAEAMIKRLND